MKSFLIIKLEIVLQPLLQGANILIAVQVNIFILHGPPQPLNESYEISYDSFYTKYYYMRKSGLKMHLRAPFQTNISHNILLHHDFG
jgi:hypothetical protein